MTIGLLGGTFNPPHRAHLALAKAALADGRVDRVWLMPTGVPPHKSSAGLPEPEHRLAMTQLLADEDARLAANDVELRRSGPSYTVDTLRVLRAARPDASFRLIIGWDMAASFDTWREARAVIAAAPPLIAWRPEADAPGFAPPGIDGLPEILRDTAREGMLAMPPSALSSSDLRRRIAEGADDAELLEGLTPAVLAYIRRNGLYGSR